MRLRSHLLLLTLVTLLPMVVFGVAATALIVRHERATFRQGAQERTRALLTALDTELEGHVTSLRALASSRQLEVGNLPAFYDELRRVLITQRHWDSISLLRPSGERLFETAVPLGSPAAPVYDPDSFERALRTGQPTVGNLVSDATSHWFPIRLPVARNGTTAYVLSVAVRPEAALALLSPQRLPSDWVGVVLDQNRRIVARTVRYAELLGQPASASLTAALDEGAEGWFHGTTIEGAEVYTPFNRSTLSGWTIAMGIPASVVEASASQAAWLLSLGVLGALAIALALATALNRRIAGPMMSLAAAAREMEGGTPVGSSVPAAVREVHDVREALAHASRAIREREDALRAADRTKDEFLAMLGHELRNPLGAMASAAALLNLDPPADAPARAAVGAVGRQVRHMSRLVDDLLDVSRATSGKVQLSRRPANLADIVSAAMDGLRLAGQLDQHDVRLELAPAWADVDEARAEQIVSNLVGNAVKYTAPGGRITVRVFTRNGDAVLEVADEGAGLSPDLLPRVFDLFVQGERALDRRTGGLGIGLTLVKRLAELHGGRVAADSAGPGRGSRFTVTLPAVGPRNQATASTATPPPSRAGRRLLLIEDNDDAREMMRAALEHYGYAVTEAADGAAGLEAAAIAVPDAVVIDLGLPGLDGYEVARQLRAMPAMASAVLVALTGYGQAEARQRALDAGFDEHLTKPVAPDRLVERLAALAAGGGLAGRGRSG
jgi:signal transduction histidine kinase/CheY-like chemotaxis protein